MGRVVSFLLFILILFLPFHNLITFAISKIWDNYLLVKAIASWKELVVGLTILVLFLWKKKRVSVFSHHILFILGSLYLLFIFLRIDNVAKVGFLRSYLLFYFFLLLSYLILIRQINVPLLQKGIVLSSIIIVLFGIIDYVVNFGSILRSLNYESYLIKYLAQDEEINPLTGLPFTYNTGQIYRIGSIVLHPLTMCIFLLLFSPYIISAAIRTKRKRYMFLALGIFICVFLSFSRGPLVIFVIITIIQLLLSLSKKQFRKIGAIFLPIAIIGSFTGLVSTYKTLIGSIISLEDNSAVARLASIQLTWDATTESLLSLFIGNSKFNYFSESDFLTISAFCGMLGIFFFYGIQIVSIRRIFRYGKQMEHYWFYQSTALSSIGIILYSLINPEYQNYIVLVVGAVLLGISVNICDKKRSVSYENRD